MHDSSLTQRLKQHAVGLGFDLVGIAPAGPSGQADALRRWLARGYHGDMGYLARLDAVAARVDVHQRLPAARSLIVLGVSHPVWPLQAELALDPARGRIASYAWGEDYHELLKPRLYALDRWLRAQSGRATLGKISVDSAPVLERSWAQQAGLGFIGKNTCLIHPRLGSWLLLATLLAPEELDPDDPPLLATEVAAAAPITLHDDSPLAAGLANQIPRAPSWQFTSSERGGCGGCTRCLADCPTQAFVAPFVLDARRCISYLTIELKGAIPRELRPQLGNWIFGCDVCQTVCPWNGRHRQADAAAAAALFAPRVDDLAPPLLELIELDAAALAARFRRSSLRRVGRRGLLRNVCVALGNWGDPAAAPALARRLADPEPLLRGHAAWALGRIHTPAARQALDRAWLNEADPDTRVEISLALDDAP
ncbi:epoxyqueuosine reductase [Candidatus Amarolinea aalborgensis]|uniref:epoxyqueuosine reductase n=1 Tax=Candidatus Amarolinea aalborgensis TaxID=2249329 RepID=UPI003BF9A758